MSVQVNQYVVYGIECSSKFKDGDWFEVFEPYFDDKYEDAIRSHRGINVIDDGMNGNYLIIGKILHKTKEGDHFEDVIRLDPLSAREEGMVREIIRLAFNISFDDKDANYYLIGHYS